jgi:hypothetical protein
MYNSVMRKTAADFLHERFLQWQLASKRKQTLRSWAEHLDVAVTSLSGWMSGTIIPAGANLEKLAAKLGPEIYDALGAPRPDPLVEEIRQVSEELSEDQRAELRRLLDDYLRSQGYRRLK